MYLSIKKANALLFCCMAFFTLALCSSCEKEVHLKLNDGQSSLVVEGAIETDAPPYVILTKSIGFFSKIDLATLEGSFAHGANITISDGVKTVQLKEYMIDTGNVSKFYFYSLDTTIPNNIMTGENGKFYSLTINYDGKIYQSTTKIPYPKAMDSIWAGDPFKFGDKVADGARSIYVNYADPDTLGNYGLYYTQVNSQPYFLSQDLYTDEFTNGSLQTNYPLTLGTDPSNKDNKNNDSLGYVFAGDTLSLKWCAVDKKVYDFWKSYVYSLNVAGNPFSTPINLKSNISNGGLGVWAGYGVVYTTLVVQ